MRFGTQARLGLLSICLGVACHGSLSPPVDSPQRVAEPAGQDVPAVSLPPPDAGVPVQAVSAGCPRVRPVVRAGRLPAKGLDEVSGVAASRSQPDLLWVHNDSGDLPRIFAIDPTGNVRAEVRLEGAEAVDFEDIAIGPGPTADKSYVYVGDIGDNLSRREQVQIYRFEEPVVGAGKPAKLSVIVQRLDLRYEDGARDAESMWVDPQAGDLFIVGKASIFFDESAVPVYRVPQAAFSQHLAVAKPMMQLRVGPATGADARPDGSGVAIRNYKKLFYWPRSPGQAWLDALQAKPCEWPLADTDEQGEAFGFRADGRGYFTIAEGAGQVIFLYGLEGT